MPLNTLICKKLAYFSPFFKWFSYFPKPSIQRLMCLLLILPPDHVSHRWTDSQAEMTDEGLHASLTEQHDWDYFRAVRTVIILCAVVPNAHFEYDSAALRKNFSHGKWISSCHNTVWMWISQSLFSLSFFFFCTLILISLMGNYYFWSSVLSAAQIFRE